MTKQFKTELTEFESKRMSAYPDIKDQLDMLYHDIKNNNIINGNWIQAIDKVKNDIKKG